MKAARTPEVASRESPLRDRKEWPITVRRGFTGAKPKKVCHWLFEIIGARSYDNLGDLFPGTGAITAAWRT